MATEKKRKPLFERLKRALEEGITRSKAEVTQRTVETPWERNSVASEETHRSSANDKRGMKDK